jgi:hypothetical protein
MRIMIVIPDCMYSELEEASSATRELGYGPEHWASDVVVSELAARRLPRVVLGNHGPRIGAKEVEPQQGHRILWPQKRRQYA